MFMTDSSQLATMSSAYGTRTYDYCVSNAGIDLVYREVSSSGDGGRSADPTIHRLSK